MGKSHHNNRSKQSKGNKDSNHDNKNKKPVNKKFKQRSSENMKQLAKLDQITGRNRPDANNDNKDNKRKDSRSNDKFTKSQKGKGFDRSGSQSRGRGRNDSRGGSKSFSRDRVQGNDRNNGKFQRNNDRNGNRNGNNNFNNKFNNNKTKQIGKFKGKGKNPFLNDNDNDSQDQNTKKPMKPMPLKGNPLFKIIPQGMDDQFAALGGSDQQQNQQYSDEEGQQMQGQQEQCQQQQQQLQGQQYQQDQAQQVQGQQQQEQQGQQGQDQDMQQDNQQQIDQDDIQDQQQEQQEQEQVKPKRQSNHIKSQQNVKNQQNQEQQGEQQQQQNNQPVDISVISLRIQQTIQILMNVQKLGGGKPRKHHLQQLKKMIHQYYGYNFELINHFLDFLNPAQMIQLFEANETHRPLTIRTNTLKTRRKQLAQSLIQRGVNLDPLAEWSKVGIKIYQSKVPIGATPQYLAGQYMLQSASSLLPVLALDPQVGQKILDMASAPGGKTTYIAQLMKNTGCVFANDLKKERLRALQFNLYRLGITNTAVTCKDGRKYPLIFPGTFDRVLLDAPCTGLGIIAKDHSIKANRVLLDIYKNSHLQKQLLLAAIDCCKVNGTIVYSTCSISPLQNQQVVNYALKRRFIKIVDCGIQVGQQGLTKFVQKRFHVDLKKTRRIYPHVHNMDGFYVAKLIKVQKGKRDITQAEQKQDMNQQRKYEHQQENQQDMEIQESQQIEDDQQ